MSVTAKVEARAFELGVQSGLQEKPGFGWESILAILLPIATELLGDLLSRCGGDVTEVGKPGGKPSLRVRIAVRRAVQQAAEESGETVDYVVARVARRSIIEAAQEHAEALQGEVDDLRKLNTDLSW